MRSVLLMTQLFLVPVSNAMLWNNETNAQVTLSKFIMSQGYNYVCTLISRENEYTRKWNTASQTPYIQFQREGEDVYIFYQDTESIKKRMEIVNKMKAGGTIVSELDLDDYVGNCTGTVKEPFPLLKTIYNTLNNDSTVTTES